MYADRRIRVIGQLQEETKGSVVDLKQQRATVLLVSFAMYFLLFVLLYKTGIARFWGYAGFVDNFEWGNFFLSIVTLACFSPLMIREPKRPSDFFIQLIILIVLVPGLVLFTGAGLPFKAFLTLFVGVGTLAATTLLAKNRAISIANVHPKVLFILTGLVAVVTLAGIFAINGTRYLNFDLSAVYEYRRAAADSLPLVFGYLISMITKVAIPFAMVYSALQKKWGQVAIFAGMSVLFFAFTGHKGPLFYPLIVILVFFGSSSPRLTHYTVFALLGILALSGLELFLATISGGTEVWFSSLFPRRGLLLPAQLTWRYVEYFSAMPFNFWSDSRITLGAVTRAYEVGIAEIVGEAFVQAGNHANSGWIGSGFAQAGYVAVIFYSILIGILFRCIDGSVQRIGRRAAISFYILPILTMTLASDLFVALLTHGVGVALLLPGLIHPATRQD